MGSHHSKKNAKCHRKALRNVCRGCRLGSFRRFPRAAQDLLSRSSSYYCNEGDNKGKDKGSCKVWAKMFAPRTYSRMLVSKNVWSKVLDHGSDSSMDSLQVVHPPHAPRGKLLTDGILILQHPSAKDLVRPPSCPANISRLYRILSRNCG